ncbi:hypothetical protein SLA2020_328400 [Shorea laevis]
MGSVIWDGDIRGRDRNKGRPSSTSPFHQSFSRKFFQLFLSLLFGGSLVARTEGVRALWKGLTPFATHLTLKYVLRMGSNAVFIL